MTMPELSLYILIKSGRLEVTRRSPTEHRFWASVNKNGPIHPVLETRCWVWTRYKNPDGYGRICHNGFQYLSHRLSWMLHNGEIPDGLRVLHKCDNGNCIRPDHLFLGTDADNAADRDRKGRGIVHVGEKVGRSKLTENKVREMRLFRKEHPTISYINIGLKFGVCGTTAECAIKSRSWKHVV